MTGGAGWEEAFVAVSVALDVKVDDALSALADSSLVRASEIVRGLRGESKGARAYALAKALATVARELERMELQ